MNLDEFNSLDEAEKFAATMFAYVPFPLGKASLAVLFGRCFGKTAFVSNPAKAAASAMKTLRSRGLIKQKQAYCSDYVAQAEYRAKDLAAILRDGEAKKWFPDNNDLLHAIGHHTAGGVDFDRLVLQAECARLLVVGSGAGMSAALTRGLVAPGGIAIARGAAWHAAMVVLDEPDFKFAEGERLFFRLMRYWLNIRFLQGRDVRKALVAIESAFRAGGHWDWRFAASFASLCFWTGWRQGLDAIPEDRGITGSDADKSELAYIVQGCTFAMDGKFAEADLAFKRSERMDVDLDYRHANIESRHVDNVPERLLSAMCAAVAKPDKIAKTRPAEVMGQSWSDGGWGDRNCPEERYAEHVGYVSLVFARDWKEALSGRGALISNNSRNAYARMVASLPLAWDFRLCVAGRAGLRTNAAAILGIAEEAEREGYCNIAGLYLSLLSGGYDEAAVADMKSRIGARVVSFLPDFDGKDEWKALVGAVRKAVSAAAKSEKRETSEVHERVIWHLTLLVPHKDGALEFNDMDMYLRPTLAPDDGKNYDRHISSWDFDKKSVRRALSERDSSIAGILLADDGYVNQSVRAVLLPKLVGMDNLEAEFVKPSANAYYGRRSSPRPVKIIEGRCEMRSSVSADGGVVLSVPKWALDATESVVLTQVDDGTLAVVKLSAGVKKLLAAFRDLGVDGKITLPPAAMKEAAPIIEEMAALLPVAAPTEAEKTKLRRVAASASLAARLDFANDALSVRIVVKPLATLPSLAIEPGEGQPERVVADATGNYLLVRDLAAEKASLAEAKSALAEFETWHDGRASWNIDDLPAALGALGALKALADAKPDAFAMEWVNDKKVSVSYAPRSGVQLDSTRTAEDWFRVEGKFALDDGRVLSVAKMLDAARSRVGNYVKLSDGDYVRLTKAMARQIDALAAAGRRKGDGVEIPRAAIPMLDGAFDGGADSLELPDAMAKTAEEIRAEFARRPSVPKALTAELRPYQTDGYRWLSRLAACGFGSCLADDMGLGKTVQVIALLLERAKGGASLVIAPSSVCGNWRSEINRFAPSLNPQMAYENEGTLASFGKSDVVIASYGYILFHEDEFASVPWNGVVLDEAQAVKNDASKRAKAVKMFQAKFRVAATGTPVENRLGELWSLFDFLNPGLLGAASSFASRFTRNGMATGELKRLVKPLVLRRLKGDVLDDLPEKTETTVMVELGKAERSAYEGCRIHALSQLEKDAEGGEPNRMSILAELTRLRRFCCHPSLVLPGEALPSAKMEALLDLLANLREGRHRVLVFSQFTDYLAIVRKAIDARGWTHLYLDGSTPTSERGKLVEAFQSGDGDFFVISLKAGGTGLNLTAADYVILLDPWWNPAVETQAADRAYRIGQRNPVTVYRLIASDTVEERVLELHKEKKQIAEDMLEGTGSAALSPSQLMGLFKSNATET